MYPVIPRTVGALVVAVALLLGCSDGGDEPGGPSATTVPAPAGSEGPAGQGSTTTTTGTTDAPDPTTAGSGAAEPEPSEEAVVACNQLLGDMVDATAVERDLVRYSALLEEYRNGGCDTICGPITDQANFRCRDFG